jgi:hypothetical protein
MHTSRRFGFAALGTAVALVTGLTAGCASSPAAHSSPPAAPAKPSASTKPPVGNHAVAAAAAKALLGRAPLPPGATLTTAPSEAASGDLSGPALGEPGTSNLIDFTRYYLVPLTPDGSIAWLQSHRPSGTTPSGTSDGSDHGVQTSAGIAFDENTPTGSYQNQPAELEVVAAPKGSASSIWRIDATDIWFNPTPVRDPNAGGHLIRVGLAAGCPKSIGSATDVKNTGADLGSRLLPPGTPTAALLCSYGGFNNGYNALNSQHRLSAAAAAKLASEIRAIIPGSYGDGVHSCPMDANEKTIMVFGYPGRADVDLWLHPMGCAYTDNGVIVAATGVQLD